VFFLSTEVPQCATQADAVINRSRGLRFSRQTAVNSSAEHFCSDEDDEGSEKASASEEIDQGVTSGGKHGLYYQCNHRSFCLSVIGWFGMALRPGHLSRRVFRLLLRAN
jgi:hypothetical protein